MRMPACACVRGRVCVGESSRPVLRAPDKKTRPVPPVLNLELFCLDRAGFKLPISLVETKGVPASYTKTLSRPEHSFRTPDTVALGTASIADSKGIKPA